ncbi:sensor histidine kinase [Variovorax sp. RA8]|uniref:sensor histidine kinase n=1 Tax=Variovorax sp. (strain JCM 16519 / RA8) TaxID=662548 RepID=UPI001318D33E|nr:histidine kinase [Variovorax sp. RA8]VTU23324.1 Sensor histidine kinase YehU [Variovorax sp. RA8]
MSDALARRFSPDNLRAVLRHGIATAGFCCVIAAALAISGRGGWASHLVYSLSIGLIAWLVIDIGRLLLAGHNPAPWPLGWRGVALVLVGASAGFLGGNAIGDAWTGKPLLDVLSVSADKVASTLLITMAASIVICYFYYSRGKSKYLEGEIALAQRDAADARLKLLETQLEPHMLFNTLANLRVLIATDPPRAVAMLDRLNSYLRVTLSGSRALAHPLSAEFQRLGDYLELMSVRMGPRLACRLQLPDDLREVPMPPLLLQPLVENAIRHGLEPKVEGGEIAIAARREGRRLVIEVRDTGVGIAESAGAPSPEGGFGLSQVRERIATVYGTEGALQLASHPAGGTCATITLPLPA